MPRYYCLKDGEIIATTPRKEEAILLIREYQKQETHYLLKSEYSVIYGEEEFIPYEQN